ncbi:MAG: aminomethyl-transferring glycine dehydrogenase subunit GcvPA [Gammaproteobacteria bacterium]|jgi:glycine dehydrogenase subunit 1|nr:aminomethyl-transferring glycine dehydrogenase subunit GcvPA [Gammaproteobacteria bacterium]
MPFIPHTEEEVREMLATIDVDSIDILFDEIPRELRVEALDGIPSPLSEMEVTRLMSERAERDQVALNFIGAGAYEHHIPAAVWQIATRGEFYTAYTPYQPEASQGTLQIIYEYQSMMTELTAMDVSNASLYDGASALAEAVLMAVRTNRKAGSRKILMPRTVHPAYRDTVRTLTAPQDIECVEVPFNTRTGRVDPETLDRWANKGAVALVIPQPNYFGVLEEVDALTDWTARNGILAIGLVNPLSLGLLRPPGEWADNGVDIACGDGQPLGSPLSSGGPYFGFLCTRQNMVRQMPGRLVGRAIDADGKPGFVLTLQAREQHIRRSRATSNICTNQGLLVTAATIHMALLGPDGLERVARACYENTHELARGLLEIDSVSPLFGGEYFHEAALKIDRPVEALLESLAEDGILGGHPLTADYPELPDGLLVCATETKTRADLDRMVDATNQILRDRYTRSA